MNKTVERIINEAKERFEEIEKNKAPEIKREELSKYIDHTLLKPDATIDGIIRLVEEAERYGFFGVCVPGVFLPNIRERAKYSRLALVSVVAFPLGYIPKEVKVFEASHYVNLGADEIDMVIHIGKAKEGRFDEIEDEIRAVVEASSPKTVKVILETALLSEEEKVEVALRAKRAGAKFVKTSTGFGPHGATVWDVILLRTAVGDNMGVKAAGGIKTYEDAIKMIFAGANRIGASRSIQIVEGAPM